MILDECLDFSEVFGQIDLNDDVQKLTPLFVVDD